MTNRLLLLSLLIFLLPADGKGLGATHIITPISNDIYTAMPKFGGANSTIIINKDSVTVVDPHSSPAAAKALIAQVRSLTDKPVKVLINTHWHGDHQGGTQAFYDAYPDIKVIAHQITRRDIVDKATPELRRMAGFYASFYQKAEAYLKESQSKLTAEQQKVVQNYIRDEKAFVAGAGEFTYALPNITIERGMTLHDDARTIELIYPGKAHTGGDLAVYLPKDKVLVSGDLLTSPYVVPRSGYPKAYAKALRKLAELDFEDLVVGHGGPVKKGKAFVRFMADFLDTVADAAKVSKAKGLDAKAAGQAALANYQVKDFQGRIEWDEPLGMKFFNFERLVTMTVSRAYVEFTDDGR